MLDVNVQPQGLQVELYRLSPDSRRWVLGVSAQLAEKDAEIERLESLLNGCANEQQGPCRGYKRRSDERAINLSLEPLRASGRDC